MTKIVISIVAGSFFAWVFGFGITEVLITQVPPKTKWDVPKIRQDVHRRNAYAVCALIVFACAVPIALNLPFFPERYGAFDKIFYTFPVIFIPALIGVWCALPKRKESIK